MAASLFLHTKGVRQGKKKGGGIMLATEAVETKTHSFLEAFRRRRSVYAVTPASPISDAEIQALVEETMRVTPSAFNSQSTRLVLLLASQHQRLWDMTTEVLRAVVPSDGFQETKARIESFRRGHGTVLFFEDQMVVERFQERFPVFQDRFPEWSQQTSAMHQIVLWTALEQAGLGASLQHYNPLIDERVKDAWAIPESWRLLAEMPFGTPVSVPNAKPTEPIAQRLKVFA
jgi:predicted oxidoreductase (fatty acid repression mutant protein)